MIQTIRLMLRLPNGHEQVFDRAGPMPDNVDSACFELLSGGAAGRVIDHYTITGDELRGLGYVVALPALLQALMEQIRSGARLADSVRAQLPPATEEPAKPAPALMPLFLVRIDDDPERTLLMAWPGSNAANVAAAADDRFDMPVTEVKFLGAVDTELDVEIAALAPHPAAVMSTTLQRVTEQLVQTLELIRHATAPEPDDGGHHEAAHDLAVDGLQRHADATAAKGVKA